MLATLLGQNMQTGNEKAKRLLNCPPRSAEIAILATVESMLKLGLIKK
jgi:dihydroflavonol-4-reductase